MNKFLCRIGIPLLFAAYPVCSACSPEGAQTGAASSAARAVPAGLARAEFTVKGMTCGGCEIGTRTVLAALDGVSEAGASYESGRAWAVYDPAKVSPAQMIAAIGTLKYTATQIQG
jgi:copper chaperone CopZ